MASFPTPSLRSLRQRRERAADWIHYASWTAIGTAVLSSVFILVVVVDEAGSFNEAAPLLSTLVGQGLVGYKLGQRSQWAAWGLMVTFAGSAVLSSMRYGIWSGILVKLAVGFVYVRGWLATLDYEEVSKQIAALPRETPPAGDAA